MGNTFGNTLHLTIFGESHGTAIGCVIDGLPAGIAIDWDKVSFEMRRRAPGSSPLATPRKEKQVGRKGKPAWRPVMGNGT